VKANPPYLIVPFPLHILQSHGCELISQAFLLGTKYNIATVTAAIGDAEQTIRHPAATDALSPSPIKDIGDVREEADGSANEHESKLQGWLVAIGGHIKDIWPWRLPEALLERLRQTRWGWHFKAVGVGAAA